jgi:prepilin-type N-terminal cleavage/methylation domain-containing protein
MFKLVKDKKGFTLIELMVVVAIVGILAAIAIVGYLDYTTKSRISEVIVAMDSLAEAAVEYHANNDLFPSTANASYTDATAFANVSRQYANFTYNSMDLNNKCMFFAQFTNLNPVSGCNLIMDISFDTNQAYTKIYDGNSTLPTKYMPK